MKKYILLFVLIMALTSLFAQNRTQIYLTLYLANPDSDGLGYIDERFPSGDTNLISFFNYNAGTTQITPYTPGSWPMGLYVDPDAIFLDIYLCPVSQPHDYKLLPLDLPNVTVYNSYHVFDYENWLTSFDMEHCASVYTFEKCSFRISGQVLAEDPGPGGGVPQDYGVRYNVNSAGNNLVRDFYVQPCETWDEWYDFTVEFSADYSVGGDLFLYTGYNHFIQFGIYPPGFDRTVYVLNIKIEFEYVPDYENSPLNIVSYNTSGEEWHPQISWYQLNNFPTAWLNYFEVEIWRQKDPVAFPAEEWELISIEDMNTTSYIDYELYSPGGGGMFGIVGTATYKIKLAQTTNNPNYDVCINIPGNEEWDESFGFSQEASIYYGSNSGNPGSIRGGDNFEYQVDGIYASNSIISFSIKDNNISNTTLNLYNIKGQLVRKFIADDLTYGRYVINWNGTNKNGKKVSSGMYLLQIQRGNLNVVKKALLVK